MTIEIRNAGDIYPICSSFCLYIFHRIFSYAPDV